MEDFLFVIILQANHCKVQKHLKFMIQLKKIIYLGFLGKGYCRSFKKFRKNVSNYYVTSRIVKSFCI